MTLVCSRCDGNHMRSECPTSGSAGCRECGSPVGHNASCTVSIRERNSEIKTLRDALRPFANIALEQDGDKRAEDMISGPDLAITPAQIRAARRALGEHC